MTEIGFCDLSSKILKTANTQFKYVLSGFCCTLRSQVLGLKIVLVPETSKEVKSDKWRHFFYLHNTSPPPIFYRPILMRVSGGVNMPWLRPETWWHFAHQTVSLDSCFFFFARLAGGSRFFFELFLFLDFAWEEGVRSDWSDLWSRKLGSDSTIVLLRALNGEGLEGSRIPDT